MINKKIAIVGYGFRMPGEINHENDFWNLLEEREIIRVPIEKRYGKGYTPFDGKAGPGRFASTHEALMLDDKELKFDCKLFGLSSHEARNMDPQIKMLLSCSWEAFEHAGWDLFKLKNSNTGVFIGTQISPTGNWRSNLGINEFIIPGSSLSMFANRISYHFNLMGPSTTTLTACSSGISALHTAVNSIRCGDCTQAVVGSSSYLGSYFASTGFGALGVISPDGKCYSFDEKANGYMRSEGVFVYIIKNLEDAINDGDKIHAVIRDTHLNTAGAEDGTKEMLQGRYITAPTGHAQIKLMQEACKSSGLSPDDFDYIEAHATGTKMGDRIEGNAIGQVFGSFDRNEPIRVSGVKSNVGHMEAAAFHCSLLKGILMMKRRCFAPISKNFQIVNPEINFDNYNMQVQTTCEPFPDHQVRMGINSFGFGGANGICILEEYTPERADFYSRPIDKNQHYLFPISARNKEALIKIKEDLKSTILTEKLDLYTLAANLSIKRTHFHTRSFLVAHNNKELMDELYGFNDEKIISISNEKPKIAMVFSGQGTQWEGGGKRLYNNYSVFRRTIDAIDAHWQEIAGFSIKDKCFTANQDALNECELAQPAIFMIQCGLVELYKSWGVYPEIVLGHSAGEMGAAYACGGLSLKDATRLVYHRATVQQLTAGSGRMLAVGIDKNSLEALLFELAIDFKPGLSDPKVEFACFNAPESNVLCGKIEDLNPIIQALTERNIPKKLLAGNIAFHSNKMEMIHDEFFERLSWMDTLQFKFDIPFVSTVTGQIEKELNCNYWWSNIRQPVDFHSGIKEAHRITKAEIYMEVSPHNALTPLIMQSLESEKGSAVCLPSLIRDSETSRDFFNSLGNLFKHGVQLDFESQYPRPNPIPHLLPNHPKDEQIVIDYDIDDVHFRKEGEYSWGPLVGRKDPRMDFGFQVRISKNDFPWLADHVVHQTPIVPAAGYIEIILEALKPKNDQFVHFKSIDFLSPCEISEIPVSLQTNLEQVLGTNSDYKFKIFSRTYDVSSTKKIHCTGQVSLKSQIPQTKNIESLVVDKFENTRFQSKADFYGHMQAIIGDNFQYGPKFQVIKTIQCNPETKELLIDLEMDEQLFQDSIKAGYILPPSLMDGGLQSFIYFLMLGVDIAGIPIRAKDLAVFGAPTTNKLICHYTPNLSMANIQQKGQLTLPLGEQCSGLLEIYDRETGLLLVKLGEYYSFHSNTKRGDLKFSKSFIQWQPKYIDSITFPKENLTIPLTLKIIEESNSKKKRIARFVEIAGQSLEKETILHQCLDQLSKDDSQSEYWLFNDEDSLVEKQFEYFNHHNSSLRFESINIRELEKNNLSKGLLRPHCAEAVFVKNKPEYLTPDHFEFYSKILIEGGLVIIDSYECDYDPNQVAGWEIVLNHSEIKILQCSSNSYGNTDNYPGDIIFLGAENSIFNNWKYAQAANRQIALAGYKDVSFENDILIKWQKEKPIEKLDFLISASEDDPYGHSIFIAFVLLMQQFVRYRQRVDCPHCTIRLVTINAVKNVKNPANSVFWGGVRSLSHEISVKENLGIELIDIDSESAFYLLNWLAENPVREREMMVRGNKIFVPRIHQIYEEFPTTKEKHTHPFKLTIDNPGQISGLQMKTYELPALGDFDVEIEVKAAALNFRDIMVMLGKLPLLSYERSELGHEVGMEACGIIRKVGKKVRSRKIGDEVLFMKGGCIANRIITNEDTTFTKPDNLTIEEGAGVLSVYVTAYYALVYLARLRRGQKVLIHSAMGGVGQAAIAIAKYLGAEIYTTAGNEEKRKNLIALGAKAAFDSHSYTWYDDLMLATQGDGVDVVLNSLAGHHIHLCLESLTPGGYHCEIGKVDIYADNTLNMCVFRKNLRFIAIDVDRLMQDDPALSRQLTKECMNLLAESKLPPIPVTIYPVAKYESAIRSMMNGEHKGKLILSLENLTEQSLSIVDDSKFLKAEATYLITGGFGGIGLQLIAYLADAGAKHITLLDRDKTGRRTADWVLKQSSLNQLYPETEIDIVPGDVTNRADVQNCINQLKKPLKGIFHLAGTIDDRLLANLDPQSIESVFLPKATGAMNLHDATKSMELDHFVMCSSIASVFGSPAQINYSAANAFLDGLADYRQNNNLPGLTFNMGAIAESGMASRDAHVLRLAKTSGIPPISTLFAIYGLDYGMRRLSTQSQLITALIKDIKWTADHPDYMRFGRVVKNQEMFKKGVGGQFTIEAVVQKVSKKVAELCGHEEIDPKEPIASFGLNSISVSELGAYINAQFNYQASVIDLMSKATAISLAQSIIDAKSTSEVSQKEIGNIETEDTGQKVEDKDAFIVPRRPSQFANKTEDHFANYQKIEKSIPKLTISDNVLIKTNGVKKTTFVTSDQKQSTETIAKLSGTLPPECQKDLDSIKGFIRKINSKHSNMLMAKKPTEFENVLLTGATGFIGRFILQEILQSDDQLTVFCLVRADSAEHGLIRIREAMKVAGIWNSTFESRIKPIIGDIGKPNFDIEEVKYHQLEQTIDAIYHYAADLTLASPYNQIRNINTVSIKNILTLAFTGQIKPIFYASTLGIFPQYFSQFRNEFSEMKIQHQMNPDINLMKEKFPLGFVGYPWSKLVVEQSLLFAQKLGLPLAIFRLPVTGISAKTGYTQSNDIKVKVASASFQMGIRPKGMEFHWSEPVDTLAKICTSISLNNDRIHTIYQCANPNPETYGIDFIDFGFKLQEVSYENFKSENQSFGSKSPLEGYWTLLDYFAPYWFSNEKTITTQPISDEAIKEDCQFEITWPGLLEMTANSYKWIHEHQELWPFEMFHSELNKEHFIERGKMISSQFRLKFEDIYGKHFLNGLSTLVDSINTESNVRNDRSSIISLNLHRIMKNVALVEKQQNLHPEINDIKIEKPIFIIGINRTGTTFLHHLFSLDDDHSTLKIYESAMPVGKLSTDTKESGDDFRIQYVKDVLASYDAHEKLRGIHNIDITAPEEDFLLLEHAFYSWTYTTLFKVPKYQKWLEKTNPLFAYNFHKKAMQNIVFQRPKSELNKQWIFKMPFHLMELETLLKVYPDAIFIQTHRDPKEFMSSWNHLVYQARSVFAPQISKECIGQEQMDFMSKMLNKATEFRKIHPELENRWIDIPFDQLISNPISIINSIYAKLGKEIDSNHLLKIEKWITDSIERRKKEGTNTHKLSDFKLSGDEVDQAFKIYLDYITTKKMKM